MVNLTAVNPKEEDRCTPPVEVMVDTGSKLSWLPKQLLLDAGITVKGKKRFETAAKEPKRGIHAYYLPKMPYTDGNVSCNNYSANSAVRLNHFPATVSHASLYVALFACGQYGISSSSSVWMPTGS